MGTLRQPVQETEQVAKCQLAETILRRFGMLRLKVTGCSMLPSIWPGDILLIQRLDIRQVIPGTIVLFSREGKLIAHRVISKADDSDNPCVVTRGDSLSLSDSPVTASELLGKVASVFHSGEWIEPRVRLGLGARLMAALVSHCGLGARILLRLHATRQRQENQEALVAR
jgi:signal peptidase I